uniref:Uncharacterized protein n=1 Tax=Daphnia pulex TaxID=6669 RepID=E9I0A0_DAPPU|nr:hypothetical protein DAPPUDRAFT_120096 [Daphnia pulex]|eukprot:EFX62580.1 hypothetical protein DAPPUDRAFT_120096 [Daphnia pulex]
MRYEDTFEIGFGNPQPRLQLLTVHRFVTGLGLQASQILAIAPVLLVGDQVVRVTLLKTADVTAILDKHGGPHQHLLEGRPIQVLIKDPNVDEKFVRISDYPPNANMGVLKVRLREFGTVLDLRQDRYAENESDGSYGNGLSSEVDEISPTVPTPSGKGVASIKGAAKVQAAKAPTTKEAPKLTTTNFPPLLPSEAAQWQTVTGRNKSRPSWEAENSCLVPETPENESTPMPSVNPSVVPETQEATPRDALAISVDTSSEGATSQISHIDTLSTVEDTLSESNDSGPDRDPQGQTRRKRTRTKKIKLNQE